MSTTGKTVKRTVTTLNNFCKHSRTIYVGVYYFGNTLYKEIIEMPLYLPHLGSVGATKNFLLSLYVLNEPRALLLCSKFNEIRKAR